MKDRDWIILVRETDEHKFSVSGEGPFDSFEDARVFASAECGTQWAIAHVCCDVHRPVDPERSTISLDERLNRPAPKQSLQ